MHPIIAEELARQNMASTVSRAAEAARYRELGLSHRNARMFRLFRHRAG